MLLTSDSQTTSFVMLRFVNPIRPSAAPDQCGFAVGSARLVEA